MTWPPTPPPMYQDLQEDRQMHLPWRKARTCAKAWYSQWLYLEISRRACSIRRTALIWRNQPHLLLQAHLQSPHPSDHVCRPRCIFNSANCKWKRKFSSNFINHGRKHSWASLKKQRQYHSLSRSKWQYCSLSHSICKTFIKETPSRGKGHM